MIVKISAKRFTQDKINAIKFIRAITGSGLREAKEFVEKLPCSKTELTEVPYTRFEMQSGDYFYMEVNAERIAHLYFILHNANETYNNHDSSRENFRIEVDAPQKVYTI